MQTKTIKIKKGEYANYGDDFKNHDIIILTGARGSGKSYPTAKYIKNHLIENEESKFFYMRISDRELHTYASWCKDLDFEEITKQPVNRLTRGVPNRGDITLYGYDSDNKLAYERVIGKCISLESSSDFKSGNYSDFDIIIFEEYTQKKNNPTLEKNYCFNFFENVISIFRDRPKKIFVIGNNLKSIPLLDRGIDELTGEIFENPLKVKIFRESEKNKTNTFLSYLNGELFDDDDFKICMEEFKQIYTNKKYVIYQHLIYPRKHYITENKIKQKLHYNEQLFLTLKYFCQQSSINEFYFQSKKCEYQFNDDYFILLQEITNFLSKNATRYI